MCLCRDMAGTSLCVCVETWLELHCVYVEIIMAITSLCVCVETWL